MSDLLKRLGIDIGPAALRAAAAKSYAAACERKAVDAIKGVSQTQAPSTRHKVTERKTKTHYLDAEEQRRKKEQLQESHAHILGMILRGHSVLAIASIYGVTDMAIYKRVSHILPLVRDGWIPVNREVAEQHGLIVKVNYDNTKSESAPY